MIGEGALTAAEREERKTWKLHVKHVTRIDFDAVRQLPVVDEATRVIFNDQIGWLREIDRYTAVPVRAASGAPRARFDDRYVDSLEEYGVVREVSRADVRGHVTMFLVAEPAKQRFRPIKHTIDVNNVLGKDTVLPLRFPTKLDIIQLVLRGTHFIALDFAAYYDQFLYAPEVGERFCFRARGKFYCLATGAMGQRHLVGVAQSTTSVFLDFDHISTTRSIIDNAIFVGFGEETVLRDATVYAERARSCGAQFNEDVSNMRSLVQQEGDWCGVHLDFVAKHVSLTQKTVRKVVASWERRATWTWRGFAAHVGLLFWSWGIIDIPMAGFFPLLAFVSRVGRDMTEDPSRWDKPANIWDSARPSLDSWTQLVVQNRPRVVRPPGPPDWLVCTDASAWGWGYVAVNAGTGEVRQYGAPWSLSVRQLHGDKLRSSVFAEPRGVVNSLCHMLKLEPGVACRVRLGTDSTVARAAFARGFNSHSKHINGCVHRLKTTFPDVSIEFLHIPGVDNPADQLSRGGPACADVREAAEGLRRVLGQAAQAAGAPRQVNGTPT